MFNRIETGDCIEGMKALAGYPTGCADLVFADFAGHARFDSDCII